MILDENKQNRNDESVTMTLQIATLAGTWGNFTVDTYLEKYGLEKTKRKHCDLSTR